MADLLKPTAFQSFELPNIIALTPTLGAQIVTELIKQLLYIKEQIAAPLDELVIQSKKVDHKRNLKLLHLIKTLDDCEQSLSNIFKFHFANSTHTLHEVAWIDILLIFGKSYVNPFETYSLRFYIDARDDHQQANQALDEQQQMVKIKAMVARNLHSMESIWDSNLPLTDLRVCAHIQHQHDVHEEQEQEKQESEEEESEETDYFGDSRFVIKHHLSIRFAALKKQKKAGKDNKLYLLNFWNKRTASKIAKREQQRASTLHNNKENVTPQCQIHDVQLLTESGDEESHGGSSKIWFVSSFKIGGLKL
eukprot:CAMPEP_0197031286 /NCGR_PEP_ID=MMETSP1384-20130603/10336_1 /TAXON_ID=29189 /ORGANISM="Ammonia sp." /LENGTH=306 /DNA_ID=CAMNT_0042460793 /DNA_START=45 /DNA_END=965 /DNA_ORIENTATION=+